MTDANADKITVLADALRRIGQARIHRAEHGRYPDDVAEDQEFDDWAADVAAEALEKAGCSEIGKPPRMHGGSSRPLTKRPLVAGIRVRQNRLL